MNRIEFSTPFNAYQEACAISEKVPYGLFITDLHITGKRFQPCKYVSIHVHGLREYQDALTASIPTNIFPCYLSLLGACCRILTRLVLQCIAEIIDAVLPQCRVHSS